MQDQIPDRSVLASSRDLADREAILTEIGRTAEEALRDLRVLGGWMAFLLETDVSMPPDVMAVLKERGYVR